MSHLKSTSISFLAIHAAIQALLLLSACESSNKHSQPETVTKTCPTKEWCSSSSWCKEFGQCAASYCGCFATPYVTAASCEKMEVCALFGECSIIDGVCKAKSIEDCKKATIPFDHFDGEGGCY